MGNLSESHKSEAQPLQFGCAAKREQADDGGGCINLLPHPFLHVSDKFSLYSLHLCGVCSRLHIHQTKLCLSVEFLTLVFSDNY
jgi:hypothetical protein